MAELGIAERFRSRVPDDVLIELVTSIRQGTRDACDLLCLAVDQGRYTGPEARDLFPYARRAHVETRLSRLMEEFPGLSVEPRFNRVGNCHRLIRMPGVLLTVSAVPTPERMARATKARRAYAWNAAGNVDFRQSFFSIDGHNWLVVREHDLTHVNDGWLYGTVVYCPAEDNPLAVGYVGVGFPDMQYRKYVETLNLTRLLPQTAESIEIERIEDLARVEILVGEPDAVDLSKLTYDGGV